MIKGLVIAGVLAQLLGCNARSRESAGSDEPSREVGERPKRVRDRIRALQERLATEDNVAPSRLLGAASVVPPPSPSSAPSGPPPKIEGVAQYRRQMELLGEKQLLTDMQMVAANLGGNANGALAKQVLDGMDGQLTKVEDAQRARETASGVKPGATTN